MPRIKHGCSDTRLYRIWYCIKERCKDGNKNYPTYNNTHLSDEWDAVEKFISWSLGNGYTDDLSIDRINPDGDYSPENCRWASRSVQSANTRLRKTNTSGYIGVSRKNGGWVAIISFQKKVLLKKMFKTAVDAAEYREAFITRNNLPHTLNGVGGYV